jgi:tRNA threonylcarbamoyladenosine biosynthesis protein TsaB
VILAFSTSSPLASVAAIDDRGEVRWAGAMEAPQRAGWACLELLERMRAEARIGLGEATGFGADLGPGSFTGVRVGVTLAKTLAFVRGLVVFGVDAFDLIDPQGTALIPSRRGEFLVRHPGAEALRTERLPDEAFSGYGSGIATPKYPHAERFAALLPSLRPISPERLVPRYLAEPSISTPKRRYGLPEAPRA